MEGLATVKVFSVIWLMFSGLQAFAAASKIHVQVGTIEGGFGGDYDEDAWEEREEQKLKEEATKRFDEAGNKYKMFSGGFTGFIILYAYIFPAILNIYGVWVIENNLEFLPWQIALIFVSALVCFYVAVKDYFFMMDIRRFFKANKRDAAATAQYAVEKKMSYIPTGVAILSIVCKVIVFMAALRLMMYMFL